jgi:uncharacterized protein (DUF885 family)
VAWQRSTLDLERNNAMKTSLTIVIFLAFSGIASAYTQVEIAAESKKANDFFEKCWDETLSRHPVDESFYGIKTHYNQLEDLSDEKSTADEKIWERQLADLKKNIRFEALDPQTQLSYKLFEREAAREAEEFKYRFDVYPVSQMRGVHAQMPTFMINIHKIDDVKDAEAYIARLRGFPKLFRSVTGQSQRARRKRSRGTALRFSACARCLPQDHQREAIRFRA